MPKARAAKLDRQLVDMFLHLESKIGQEVQLCQHLAKEGEPTFLCHSLEIRLIALYYDTKIYCLEIDCRSSERNEKDG